MRDFQTVGPHILKHGNEVVSAGEVKCSSWDTSTFKGPRMKANVSRGERAGRWDGQQWHISYEILLKWNKTKEQKTQSNDFRYWLKINGMNVFWAKNQCNMFLGMYLWYSRAGEFREECLLKTKHLGFNQKVQMPGHWIHLDFRNYAVGTNVTGGNWFTQQTRKVISKMPKTQEHSKPLNK